MGEYKDLNKERLNQVSKLVGNHFQHSWQWELEIEGAPEDFRFYVKDISYGAIEIETETKNVGSAVLTMPVRSQPVSMSMTMRDNQDELIYQWFANWASQVINGSGSDVPDLAKSTVNVAQKYLKKCTRHQIVEKNGEYARVESPGRSWEMFVTVIGDISESYDDHGSFLEFPITCIQQYSA